MAGNMAVVLAVRVKTPTTLVAGGAAPGVHGMMPATGTIAGLGVVHFALTGNSDAGSVTYTFDGEAGIEGSKKTLHGTWSGTNGTSGTWHVTCIVNLGNDGAWSFNIQGTPTNYSYNVGYAVLGQAGGENYLVMMFDSPSVFWPVDAMIIVASPASVALNTPTELDPMFVVFTPKTADRYRSYGPRPTVTFTARPLRVGGRVSGSVSGQLSNSYHNRDATITSVTFTAVRIIGKLADL